MRARARSSSRSRRRAGSAVGRVVRAQHHGRRRPHALQRGPPRLIGAAAGLPLRHGRTGRAAEVARRGGLVSGGE
eukprot:2011329-Pleurochrysis_carterae.AAC.3